MSGKILAVLGAAALAFGCGGPYKGKPEKLPKVKKSKKPAEETAAVAEVVYDEECSAKFTEDASKAKRSASKASSYVSAGEDAMSRAASSPDMAVKASSIVLAIEQYKKALLEDHYNAPATYGLAVAYATVRKKGCALKMLKRLAELGVNARLAGGQSRLDSFLNSVEDEAAFRPFKNDAMAAIGR